jgi:cytochrome b
MQSGGGIAVRISDWTGAAGTGYDDLSVASFNAASVPMTVTIDTTGLANFSEGLKSFTVLNTTGGITLSKYQFTELFRQAGFYGFVRKEIPEVLGHNQLAASAYLVLFALLLIETVTGFALDGLMGAEPGATLFGWLRELLGAQTLRQIHHLSMWLILAIALFHVYSCILVDHIEHNGLISSIVSGWKFPTRHQVVASRDGGPELLDRAEEP